VVEKICSELAHHGIHHSLTSPPPMFCLETRRQSTPVAGDENMVFRKALNCNKAESNVIHLTVAKSSCLNF